jgi:hypothetical protein
MQSKEKVTCRSSLPQVFVQRKLVCHLQLDSGPIFRSQAVQQDISTPQDRTDKMSWNVTNKWPRYATQHLRRAETSFPDMLGYRCSEITAVCVWLSTTRLIMRFMKKLYSQNLQMQFSSTSFFQLVKTSQDFCVHIFWRKCKMHKMCTECNIREISLEILWCMWLCWRCSWLIFKQLNLEAKTSWFINWNMKYGKR